MPNKTTVHLYLTDTIPKWYTCKECGKSGVKLWRPYQTFNIKLLCTTCAAKAGDMIIDEINENGEVICHEKKGKKPKKPDQFNRSYSIGWWVPAVPCDENYKEGFWGFTSIPELGVKWWQKLSNF